MPRKDGFAVLEFLKGNPEWAVIPTIVFLASGDLDDIKKAYMLGASSYHVKPRTHEALVHQILVLHAYWMTCEVPRSTARAGNCTPTVAESSANVSRNQETFHRSRNLHIARTGVAAKKELADGARRAPSRRGACRPRCGKANLQIAQWPAAITS